MQLKTLFIFLIQFSFSCNGHADQPGSKKYLSKPSITRDPGDNPYTHIGDIPLPAGFRREPGDMNSFAVFLRNTGLKKDKTVLLFNGQVKHNQSAQYAVLNITVGNRNLQQCADAVMRLRSEFLFTEKRYEQIIFFDNDNSAYKFSAPYTRENFMIYLNRVFGMCGSASLSKQLKPVADLSTIQAGDVFIRGGFPGHAVIVMDVVVNEAGKKIYLLAQSYMPAQDIHVLKNPMNESLSPWYEVNDDILIETPEYIFHRNELKRWKSAGLRRPECSVMLRHEASPWELSYYQLNSVEILSASG
ncbi:MAG TPA: DUF4846 domain-containing protein [Ferruginibacter sp.]|nr:DUF4846 domain-containing protein [Ferruginibacter sp.]